MSDEFDDQYNNAERAERPAPLPLRRTIAPAASYPLKALGKLLEDGARAIMDKVACPDALAAQSALGAAALAVQAHVDVVHPATGDRRPISLFLVTVAASGDRKTAADKFALEPVGLREAELYEKHERDRRAYLDAKASYEHSRDATVKSKNSSKQEIAKQLGALPPPPVAPLIPLLTIPEPTLEGLHKFLALGEPSIGLFSDEGGTFIGGYGMSDDIRLRTGSGLSDLWDGKAIKRVRGGDGVLFLKGRRLSLHLMVQPGIAEALLADPILMQQGLLSRVLVSAPPSIVAPACNVR